MNKENPNQGLDQLRATLRPANLSAVHALLYPALALGVGSSAQAATLYGSGPLTVSDNGSFAWDINGGGAEVTVADWNVTIGDLQLLWDAPAPGFGLAIFAGDEMLPVTPATTIGAANTFLASPCTPFDRAGPGGGIFAGFTQWGFTAPGGTGVFGFQFDNSGTTNYGIAEFTFASWDSVAPVGTFTINRWAYEDSGASISGNALAVPVPEPTTTGAALMSLAVGAAALRRRRRKAATKH